MEYTTLLIPASVPTHEILQFANKLRLKIYWRSGFDEGTEKVVRLVPDVTHTNPISTLLKSMEGK